MDTNRLVQSRSVSRLDRDITSPFREGDTSRQIASSFAESNPLVRSLGPIRLSLATSPVSLVFGTHRRFELCSVSSLHRTLLPLLLSPRLLPVF